MKAPNKNKRKIVTVSSKDDPRYQAYKDSLTLYEYTELQKKLERERPDNNFLQKVTTGQNKVRYADDLSNQEILRKKAEDAVKNSPNLKFGTHDNKNILGETYPEKTYTRPSATPNRKGRETVTIHSAYDTYAVSAENRGGGSWDIHSPHIKPKGNWMGLAINNDYSNVNPKEEVRVEEPRNETDMQMQKTIAPIRRNPKVSVTNKMTPATNSLSTPNPKAKVPFEMQPQYYDIKENVNQNFGGNTKSFKTTNKKEVDRIKAKNELDKTTITGKDNTIEIKPFYGKRKLAKGGTIEHMRKKRIQPKKAFYGALIGTGLSLINSLASQGKEKRLLAEQEMIQDDALRNSMMQQDKSRLRDFNPEGSGSANYYQAKGGKLRTSPYNTKGGKLVPLSSDSDLAVGNKHDQSTIDNTAGIKLYDGKAKPVAEIEGGEVVKNDTMVFSDETIVDGKKTYADVAKKLAKDKGKAEIDPANQTSIAMNTNKRKLALLDAKENALFAHQESNKDANGMPRKMATGGGIDPPKKKLKYDEKPKKSFSDYVGLVTNLENQDNPRFKSDFEKNMINRRVQANSKSENAYKALRDDISFTKIMSKLGHEDSKKTIENSGKTYNSLVKARPQTYRKAVADYPEDAELYREHVGDERYYQMLDSIPNKKRKMATGGNLRPRAKFKNLDEIMSTFGDKDKEFQSKTDWKGIADNVMPYVDNIGNAILTANAPKIPKLRTMSQTPLRTKVNAQPQLDEVTRAVDSSSTFIKNNTSNSATARNEITGARLQGAGQKAAIMANKQNTETSLYNANVQNSQNISARNLAAIEQNAGMQFQRLNDIQSRVSGNLANIASDYVDGRNTDNVNAYNKDRVDIAKRMYQSDTTRRDMLDDPTQVQRLLTNKAERDEALAMFKGTKEEARLKQLLGITD